MTMPSVNLIVYDNRAGLSRDATLLRRALVAAGCEVQTTSVHGDRRGRGGLDLRTRIPLAWSRLSGRRRRYDVNIMIERIRPLFADAARVNLLLANPDWFKDSDARHLPAVDAVLIKTRHAEPIFAALGKPVRFIGFTSADRLERDIAREPTFFHLAGRSPYKGTRALVDLWLRHPQWPRLTLAQHARHVHEPVRAPNIVHRLDYLDDRELQRLQNANAFHLCPSETEGFGHYLVEAMSVGALVVTTDAAPMNELVSNERGVLVPWAGQSRERLATLYRVDPQALETAVERILCMTAVERQVLGDRARAWFEHNDHAFTQRVAQLIRQFA